MVEDSGIEPLTQACKASVFPIRLIPHIYGALEETRTPKTWFLRPVRIPIPSPGQNMAVLGGNDPHSYGVTSRRASMNTLRPNKNRLLVSQQAPN